MGLNIKQTLSTLIALPLHITSGENALPGSSNTKALLHWPPVALHTYRFQSEYHGYPTDREGLPRENTVCIPLHFIQDAILDELEHGFPFPASILL